MKICLIRHGQTDWNTRHLLQGHTDNPLNETGKKQAESVGRYLLAHDADWDLILTSPLQRAIETGKIIAKAIGYQKEILIEPNIIERSFGTLEGETLDSHTYNLLEKGGYDVESFEDLKKRSKQALLHLENQYPDKKILAISHAQFIKSAIANVIPDFNFRSLLFNSSLSYFQIQQGKITLLEYNINPAK